MGEMITCTRYGAPCTMTREACRKRWELAHKPHHVEIDLTPCLNCPEHESKQVKTSKRRRNRDFPAKRKLESGLLADGYISMAAGLQDVYSRMTIAEIAEKYGASGKTVLRYLRESGVKTRRQCTRPGKKLQNHFGWRKVCNI